MHSVLSKQRPPRAGDVFPGFFITLYEFVIKLLNETIELISKA